MGIYLDDRFTEHPKFVAAGSEAMGLWVAALAYVNRNKADGLIHKNQIPRLTDFKRPMKIAERLVDVGLWYDRGDHYEFHDYKERNEAQIARREKASKAARTRWHGHSSSSPPSNARSMLEHCSSNAVPHTTNPTGVTNQALSEPPRSKTDTEGDQLIAAAIDILARRDLANTTAAVHDQQAWLATARQRRHNQHVRQIRAALTEQTDWTADQLAAWVDPDIPGLPVRHDLAEPPAPASYERPACDLCHGTGMRLDDAGDAHRCDHPAA
ncbi:hypothetical protein K6U06_06515 [Acidiferrimicrobium sp. IK]|uniref:hypothetical protein n=1 Tax=Acidiferrimicrobium sp. IK TaxID=2871700 RepID=UPI0021CB8FC0|nr:hypothetical protein [Acidiferrimicrobium sp. IK]MCU4184006.1 hypothetical protein [Acidiferrimicrobium sp. IK]